MCECIGVAIAALVICVLILARDPGTRPDGLPTPPGDADCPAFSSQVADHGRHIALTLRGPACRDVKEFQFQEAGQDTEVDLEHASAGGTVDLSYDHFTGELKPTNGAKVSLYDKDNGWGWLGSRFENQPRSRSDFPGEQECREKSTDWRDTFNKGDLEAEFSIFCIKTAENHDGFLLIKQIANQKPDAYDVYSYIWVH